MFIDVHTHVYPEKVARKVTKFLADYYGLPVPYSGTLSELERMCRTDKVDAIVTLAAATRPDQVRAANEWMLNEIPTIFAEKTQVVRFGTFHVEDPNTDDELSKLADAGIRGIKIHPEFQGVDLADPRLFKIFDKWGDRFVFMVHVGDPPEKGNSFSSPQKLAAIAVAHPQARIIAAHMGGYLQWDAARESLAPCPNVYVDTSSSLEYMSSAEARKLYDAFGVERILLGSDYPMMSPQQALDELNAKMPWLAEDELSAIRGDNAAALLNL